ncbi:hypothetical protein [Streptomyces viridochromogenes]|uniref:Uncharacterized protein n=1 Tax=Streptomyces viridochromogenes Tue57 TaxID=1160705 RepID=L8P3B5_STRVR|nr:hypothetical protein [Streptomyces viridochromogenes]ELS50628.1 hypothetical protein STVIR_8464 [Streptomyces viridochromogenes Tue57]
MRAPRTLRTTFVAAGVSAALGASAAGAFAGDTPDTASLASLARHAKAKRVQVKTVKLADRVSRAKVYKTGKHRYEAEIWAGGVKYGTLHAQGKAARGLNNGLHITLHPNGEVTSWVERAEPRPKPEPVVQRVLVATPTLADGATTAKLYRLTADHYEADVFANGVRLDTLVSDGRPAYGEHNGLHVALQPDGRLASWLDDASATPDALPTAAH